MAKPKTLYLYYLLLVLSILILVYLWTRGGFDSVYFNTDIGRDLYELSNLWIGKSVIWLGPRLSAGFHASPIYYYLFYPALWLSRGDPESIIIFNLIIVTLSALLFGLLSIMRWGTKAIVGIFYLGLMPWWVSISLHPGNGFTYAFGVIISLVLMYFESPLFLSSLFLGISISFHPAAIFALPILLYECYRRKTSLKSFFIVITALLLPWTPIILFEIITKGYILRHWLAAPISGMGIMFNNINLNILISYLGLNVLSSAIVLPLILSMADNRLKMWITMSLFSTIFFLFVSPVPHHYILGIASIWSLIIVFVFLETKKHKPLAVALLLLMTMFNLYFLRIPEPATRSMSKISNIVTELVRSQKLNPLSKIATISVLDKENKVPQADDYRALLRFKGYDVLEPDFYSQADLLLMFVEVSDFDWEHWSTWEIDQVGKKNKIDEIEINGIKVVIFQKEHT